MKLTSDYGIEYPLFGFSHCRDVVAEISRAGGFGVMGAALMSPEQLDLELSWLDEHVDGLPYGVDVIIPAKYESSAEDEPESYERYVAAIPQEHWDFVERTMRDLGVPPVEPSSERLGWVPFSPTRAHQHVEVAVAHNTSLIVNAMGPLPDELIRIARNHDVRVGALAGSRRHAERHAEAGLDIVIAQGVEAGGHVGDVATMVLTPEIVDTVSPIPVLAAGGIGSGRQMAASLALGASGVWVGSIWLTTAESDTPPEVRKRYLAATSSDTVVTSHLAGKPARKLRTAWTEAWASPSAPPILPAPLQGILTAEAEARMTRSQRWDLVDAPVGQIVGYMNRMRSTRDVVFDIVQEYISSIERIAVGVSDQAS